MRIGLILLSVLGVIAFNTVISIKQALKNLDITISKTKLLSSDFSNIKLQIDVLINNPSNKALSINNFKANIIYQGQIISRIFRTQSFQLPKKAGTLIRSEGLILGNSIVDQFIDILKGKQIDNNIIIDGQLNYKGVIIPFKETHKLS